MKDLRWQIFVHLTSSLSSSMRRVCWQTVTDPADRLWQAPRLVLGRVSRGDDGYHDPMLAAVEWVVFLTADSFLGATEVGDHP